MRILITGGTGALGREITRAAENAGYMVRIGSRSPRAAGTPSQREWTQMQMATGEGFQDALVGIQAVIHAASDPRRPDAVDVNGTRFLVEASRAAGIAHLVFISIVGIDGIPFGYYQSKLAAERIIEGGGVPYSILRATQFHTLVDMLFSAAARFPLVMPLPTDFRVQSVAPFEVADRLVRCAREGPGGRLADFGGPEMLTIGEAAREWKAAKGVRKPVLHLPLPGRVAAAFRAGRNTVREGEHGTLSWRQWLGNSGTCPR
jgi:uncharacterized protein YbjT (DUF2867 family)